MSKEYKLDYASPIGVIEIIGTKDAVYSIMFCERSTPIHERNEDTPQALTDCRDQLDEYFQGMRHEFTFPYSFEGTDFQETVWNALVKIPYAETGQYKELAETIGNGKAVRAVGNANSKNRLSIVVPCHRIIGSNGRLTGYAGGLWRKEWLLQHENTNKGIHDRGGLF
jgi:methylated-DNA-[protein]-cysteine S-methyltransferase